MNACKQFGEFLRDLRTKKGYGLREFARKIDILPSNYHHVEAGINKPPQEQSRISRILLELGIADDDALRAKFYDLHGKAVKDVPLDVAEVIKESDAIPMLLRTIDNRKLTEREVRNLIKHVRGIKQ